MNFAQLQHRLGVHADKITRVTFDDGQVRRIDLAAEPREWRPSRLVATTSAAPMFGQGERWQALREMIDDVIATANRVGPGNLIEIEQLRLVAGELQRRALAYLEHAEEQHDRPFPTIPSMEGLVPRENDSAFGSHGEDV